jgi:predicted phage terminase large subunit-like protein
MTAAMSSMPSIPKLSHPMQAALAEKIRDAGQRLEVELARRQRARELDDERLRLEGSLSEFVRAAWRHIDPSDYEDSWAIEGLCAHLQAVTENKIPRLCCNYPPRCGKTLVTSVCWIAWTWARRWHTYRSGPAVKFLCGSYSHALSLMNSNLTRRLIMSDWYQERWGDRFCFLDDQNTKVQFDNNWGGSRISTSIGGTLLGVGANIICVDDPHNTADIESEAERDTVIQWWKEISSTRLNDPKQSAVVLIMQRLHEEDCTGHVFNEGGDGWTSLMLPMEYDIRRHCITSIGWEDPRGLDDDGSSLFEVDPDSGAAIPRDAEAEAILEKREGALMWPERFGPKEVNSLKRNLGPYLASGRLQQSPAPKSGGILRRDWWMLLEPEAGNKFPPTTNRICSVDGAFSERTDGDFSAFTIWGITRDPKTGRNQACLMSAWHGHLPLHGDLVPRMEHEVKAPGDRPELLKRKDQLYKSRAGEKFGLVEKVRAECLRLDVDRLLIEAKGPGISVAQEFWRLYSHDGIMVEMVNPKADKVARAHACVPLFANELIWAPAKDWAEMVINEATVFPRGKHDDLVDSTTQALLWYRQSNLLRTGDEYVADDRSAEMSRGKFDHYQSVAERYFGSWR